MGREVVKLVLTSFMTALAAVLAQVKFNVGPVPYTMQNMAVMLAGLLLPPKYAAASLALYLLLIALGLPLASGFAGGLAVILGFCGGYLAGFVIAAPLMSILSRAYLRRRGVDLSDIRGKDLGVLLLLSLISALPIYVLGFLVFSYYAVPGTGIYSWSLGVGNWLGVSATSRFLLLFTVSVLIFIPQDLFMDHLLAIAVARGIAKALKARGLSID